MITMSTPLAVPPLVGRRIVDSSQLIATPWRLLTLPVRSAELAPMKGAHANRTRTGALDGSASVTACVHNRAKSAVHGDRRTPEGSALVIRPTKHTVRQSINATVGAAANESQRQVLAMDSIS